MKFSFYQPILLAGVAATLLAPPLLGGPLNRAVVDRDASWLVHLDVEALSRSALAPALVRNLDADTVARVDDCRKRFGLAAGDIKSITVYGMSFEDDGVAVLTASQAADALAVKLPAAGLADFKNRVENNVQFFSFTLERRSWYAAVRPGNIPEERLVLIAATSATLEKGLKVVSGISPALPAAAKGLVTNPATTSTPPAAASSATVSSDMVAVPETTPSSASTPGTEPTNPTANATVTPATAPPAPTAPFDQPGNGSILFVLARNLSSEKNLDAAVLRNAKSLVIDIGEDGGNEAREMYARAVLTATSPAVAEELRQAAQGVLAMVSMMAREKQTQGVADALRSISVSADGDKLLLASRERSDKVAEKLSQMHGLFEHLKLEGAVKPVAGPPGEQPPTAKGLNKGAATPSPTPENGTGRGAPETRPAPAADPAPPASPR